MVAKRATLSSKCMTTCLGKTVLAYEEEKKKIPFFSLIKIEHWLQLGPIMVDSLFMFIVIVCNAGLCFFFHFLHCSELSVFVLRCLLVLEIRK